MSPAALTLAGRVPDAVVERAKVRGDSIAAGSFGAHREGARMVSCWNPTISGRRKPARTSTANRSSTPASNWMTGSPSFTRPVDGRQRRDPEILEQVDERRRVCRSKWILCGGPYREWVARHDGLSNSCHRIPAWIDHFRILTFPNKHSSPLGDRSFWQTDRPPPPLLRVIIQRSNACIVRWNTLRSICSHAPRRGHSRWPLS